MAKVTPPPGTLARPPRSKGNFYIRADPKRGWIAEKWPTRYRRTKGVAYQNYKILEFGSASQIASMVNAYDLVTLQNMAFGTTYTWRDLMIRAIYGRLYNLRYLDGTKIEAYRDVNPNPQFILDLVTDVPGSLLYRGEQGWFGLDPGPNGTVLTMDPVSRDPQWMAPATGGGNGRSAAFTPSLGPQSTQSLTTGYTVMLAALLTAGEWVSGIALGAQANASTGMYAGIYSDNNGAPNALLASSTLKTGLAAGINKVPFTAPYQITTDGLYWFAILALTSAPTLWHISEYPIYKSGFATLPSPAGGAYSAGGNSSWAFWPY